MALGKASARRNRARRYLPTNSDRSVRGGAHPRRQGRGEWRRVASTMRLACGPVADAAAATARGHAAIRQREGASAWARRRLLARTPLASASALVGRLFALIAQAEEPDQPEHEQPHVDYAEAEYEDPPLRAHRSMIDRLGRGEKPKRTSATDARAWPWSSAPAGCQGYR